MNIAALNEVNKLSNRRATLKAQLEAIKNKDNRLTLTCGNSTITSPIEDLRSTAYLIVNSDLAVVENELFKLGVDL
jgi:hypothetical protein